MSLVNDKKIIVITGNGVENMKRLKDSGLFSFAEKSKHPIILGFTIPLNNEKKTTFEIKF